MHILHLINNCNRGGAGHVLLPLIEEQRKQNIKFTVAYLEGPESLKSAYQELGAETKLLKSNPFYVLYQLYKIVNDKNNPVSLIHTHLVQASLIGRFIGLISKKPIITTRHYLERSKKYNPLYLLEDYTSRWSDRVVAISHAVETHIIYSRYVSSERCLTVYNPISKGLLKAQKKIALGKRKNIVCNARFIKIKGIRYLVDAFSLIAEDIPESKLIIIGRYRDDDMLVERIRKHKYSSRIILKGFVPRESIIHELAHARIYVQPSLSEGLGLAALEAMGMQCPCIFTNIGGLVELSQEGKNALLVPTRSSKAIATEISALWKDENRSKQLAENARKFVIENFDSADIAEQYLQVYNNILEERARK